MIWPVPQPLLRTVDFLYFRGSVPEEAGSLFPLKNQFEQFMNAAYIQKLGYGRHFDDLSADAIKAFLYDLDILHR